MMKNKKAFTLAEVLITLTILGVVAAIVIPTMLRNNGEVAERTKLKKAIVDYEKVIENMRISEGYTTVDAMKTDMNVAGCEKSRGYFKTKTVDSSDGCIFQTSDGLWWNVTDISKPIVALEKGDDNKYIKDDTYAKKSSSDDEGLKAFYMTVTQGTAEQGHAFMVNYPTDGDANKILAFAKLTEANPEINLTTVEMLEKFNNGDYDNACATGKTKACTSHTMLCILPGGDFEDRIRTDEDCSDSSRYAAMDIWYTYDDKGNILLSYGQFDTEVQLKNSDGDVICQKWNISSKSCGDSSPSSGSNPASEEKIVGSNKEVTYSNNGKAVLENFSDDKCDKISYTAPNGEEVTFTLPTSSYLEITDGQYYSSGNQESSSYASCNGSATACASYAGATAVEAYTMPLGMMDAMGYDDAQKAANKVTVYKLNDVTLREPN